MEGSPLISPQTHQIYQQQNYPPRQQDAYSTPPFQQPVFQPQPSYNSPTVLYVYAPQGSFAVPNQPGLLAIPQGQTVPVPGQNNYSYQPSNNLNLPQFTNIPPDAHYVAKGRKLAVAALVTYIVGMFTFLPYLASLIISFHMVRKGFIRQKRDAVLAFSVLELVGWLFVCSFCWYYTEEWTYSYGYWYLEEIWWGWISLVVWWVFGLAFGIPRIMYIWAYEKTPLPNLAILPLGSPTQYQQF